MSTLGWYLLLIVLVALERVAELVVSTRNVRWARRRGGVERGGGHYPPMVVLHTGLLAGALLEVWLLERPFLPVLGWAMVALVVLAQALRWWCIAALGRRWSTRVVVVPGLPLVRRGPYRWGRPRASPWSAPLRHPNYVAVVVEGVALPLVHGAWLTAVVFTVLNGWLLRVRIRTEERALAELAGPAPDQLGAGSP